ncbi:amino acid adenylation domain-containing protein [Photorhabdus temperata subsp. temperata]
MKESQQLLSLREKGIYLAIAQGSLIYKALSGEPDPATLTLLKEHKADLLRYFKRLWQRVEQTERDFPAQGNIEIGPLSFSQERLWITEQLGVQAQIGQYNITGACQLTGTVDAAAVERALEALVLRQPVLRTVIFEDAELGVMQFVRENVQVPFQQRDLSVDPDRAEAQQQLILQEERRTFDLTRDVMLRVHLLRLGEAEHVLIFTMHHIVSDGWSMNILLSEFGALYNAALHQQDNPLPPLSIHYIDYARWQRHSADADSVRERDSWWKAQLAGAPPVHSVPLDFPRPVTQRFQGGAHHTFIASASVSRLEILCRQHNATLFMGLHAIFSVLLARYGGEKDIVIGTPIANRERAELDAMIGFFVNTLALRLDLSGSPTFEALLARSQRCVADAFAHALPFGQVVEAAQAVRRLSYSPLFQIVISLQSNPQSSSQLDGLAIQPLAVESHSAKFDLALDIESDGGDLRLKWEYNTDIFSHTTIERMAQHFSSLFFQMVNTPAVNVFNLPLLSEEEEQKLLKWGGVRDEVWPPEQRTLIECLYQQINRDPQAIALEQGGKQLSYGELAQRIAQTASVLVHQEVRPGDVVGVCVEKSFDWVATLFVIWRCGGVYLPLAPSTPPQRANFILDDAAARLLIYDDDGASVAEGVSALRITLRLSEIAAARQVAFARVPELPNSSEATAYLIYTSGTTGQPKGVIVNHSNVVSVLDGVATRFAIGADAIMPAIASAAFDISLFEVVMPLIKGGRVMLYRQQEVTDIVALVQELDRWTALHAVPALMRAILDEYDGSGVQPMALRSLFTGGDSVPTQILRRLRATFTHQQIVELYGPTEETILSTACQIAQQQEALKGSTIGHPLPHAEIYILDEADNLTPQGVAGELCIGGAGVAAGYLNRPEETARRFIRYSPRAKERRENIRLYRTGDRARWLVDGSLEFLGRNDHQVKIRGFRIESGEIETLLCQRNDISQALVMIQELQHMPGLVAYVVGEKVAEPESLRSWLAERVPDYMVPTAWCVLPALPLSNNGKVDRSKLPQVSVQHVAQYTAPRNPREEALYRIWQQVLGVTRVGIHDDFFAIGGHSLAAIRVNALCRRELKLDLPLLLIFEHKTIAKITPLITEQAEVTIPHTERPRYPLSFAQEQMLFIEELGIGGSAYHLPYFSRLDRSADLTLLLQAINHVVDRHPVLKSIYEFGEENEYEQVIIQGDIETRHVRLENEAALLAAVETCIAEPFDLYQEPGLRIRTWETEGETWLLLLFHHIIFDGWSERVFMFELAHIYNALLQNQPVTLSLPSIGYGDYAYWERHMMSESETFYDFWRTQLRDVPPLALPLDYPRPANLSHAGQTYPFVLEDAFLQRLKVIAREEGTTVYTILLSAFFLTLASVCRQKDIAIGTPTDNRDLSETQHVVGLFTNTLVLRSKIDPDTTLSDYIASVHQLIAQAKSHQQLPFGKVVEMLAIRPDPAINPVFQVLFSVADLTESEKWQQLPLDFTSGRQKDALYHQAKVDLSLDLTDRGDHIYGGFTYATTLMKESTVAAIAERLREILMAFCAGRNRPLHTMLELELTSGDDEQH